MRGKVLQTRLTKIHHRITPAYAGKSGISDFAAGNWWDHPRLCGEKCCWTCFLHLPTGSPPPMRGKDEFGIILPFCDRITPAYAGKRILKRPANGTVKDHPRLCGEKVILNRFTAFTIGSPPPMRGKVILWVLRYSTTRITPAYAGKSP